MRNQSGTGQRGTRREKKGIGTETAAKGQEGRWGNSWRGVGWQP